jgi:hypothetical protein
MIVLGFTLYSNTCHNFHSTAYLDLSWNNLMGTIPTQIGILSQLSKSGFVVTIVVMSLMKIL